MSSSEPGRLFYYAYGSNLHPARLGARIPSSQLVGVAELAGYQLAFHKRGADLSAKCNAVNSGDLTDSLFGALFSISAAEKPILDEIEGPGYAVYDVVVEHAGVPYRAFIYMADAEYIDNSLLPFQWYKDFVLLGARFQSFPDEQLQLIDAVPSINDANVDRQAKNESILKLMKRSWIF
ncbi:MAG: gamma-glutamylcyclotransferase family protein [Pseudomonadales bacterium]